MRDYIRHVAGNLKVLGEKVKLLIFIQLDKVQIRQDNLNNEILSKVKKDLGSKFSHNNVQMNLIEFQMNSEEI